jgi:prepilin-type N-terminal cleavage/methylation domain-containing protein
MRNAECGVKNREWGFTLIELIVVIVILLILSAVIAPKITNVITGTRINTAARKIASDIRYAQSLAISAQTTYGVIFNPNPTNTYSLYQNTSATIITNPFSGGLYTVQLNTGEYDGITIWGSGSSEVKFDSLGSPTLGGGSSVIISNNGAAPTRAITVAANTGKVSIN